MIPELAQYTKVTICDVKFTPVTVNDLHCYLASIILRNQRAPILHINVHAVNLAQTDHKFRDILNTAPLVFCDGFGIRLGASILGYHVPPRITYADWMWQLAEFATQRDFTFFFLGAKPGVAEEAAAHLRVCFPRLKILGTHHGYFDKTLNSPENAKVIQKINDCKPNILIVSLGMPLQEYWLNENWDSLEVNVALTAGAAFDYVSGELNRAPKWMTDHGLEWLGRLIIEPHRLWKRYLIGNPVFLYRVIRQRLGSKDS